MATTLDIQQRLKALGFGPAPLDGIMGAQTRAALHFQAKEAAPVEVVIVNKVADDDEP